MHGIQVRDAQITWSGPVPGDVVHPVGADAPLQVTIVNDERGPGGPDRLVSVSSPVASSVRVVGDPTIPDGQVLVAGYDRPVESITLDGGRAVRIVLEDLTATSRTSRPRREFLCRRCRGGAEVSDEGVSAPPAHPRRTT